MVGWKLADIQVMDIKPWTMHAEVAERFVTCDNQVILVGDAAHRFPPAGGFGKSFIEKQLSFPREFCFSLPGFPTEVVC